ncbi:MAG: ATPase, T2SS/T4P/T4SS family [Vicinamibacterales bacterium]
MATLPSLPELLRATVDMGASDLHLSIESPPQVRIHGDLVRLDFAPLTPTDSKALAYSVLTDAQKKRFEETWELDCSFGIKGVARFRCNMYNQRGAVAAAYRQIPDAHPRFDELHLPVVAKLADLPRGLILVTGPTGSGKSTTLAAMVDKINTEQAAPSSPSRT